MSLPEIERFPEFVPHPIAGGGHPGTITSALLDPRRRSVPPTPRRWIIAVDEHTSVTALCSWQPERRRAPTMVLVHGLTGDADSGYVRGTAMKAWLRGFNTVRVNVRNCGGTEALTSTLYHVGLSSDLRAVVSRLIDVGLPRIYCTGFSMGANIVLKMAGEWGDDIPEAVRGLVAVSPPIELAASSKAIDTGFWNGLYQRSFLKELTALVRRKAEAHPGRYDVAALRGVRNLRDFDGRFVAPCFGFADADDYYERASAGRVVAAITVPTLVLHAADDSLVPIDAIAEWQARRPENVRFAITERGGHVAFLGAEPAVGADHRDLDRFWAENRVVEFCGALERG